MEIKREVITKVMIDEVNSLSKGDTVKFIANGICSFGIYDGMTVRGALKFSAKVGTMPVTYNVMPKSIEAIEVIEHGC